MLASIAFTLVTITNTYFWFGGQGYCSYEFALQAGDALTDVEIVFRPTYDVAQSHSGRESLDDTVIKFESLGTARVDSAKSFSIETDCSVEEFSIVRAQGKSEDGALVDLLKAGDISFEKYDPVAMKLGE